MKKLSQKQLAFLYLYYNQGHFTPPWQLMGELEINGKHYFGSYKMAARLSDLFYDAPGVVSRMLIKGESGAKYYGYSLININNSLEYFLKQNDYYEKAIQ